MRKLYLNFCGGAFFTEKKYIASVKIVTTKDDNSNKRTLHSAFKMKQFYVK
jgi:hypothetical protein